MKVVPRLIPVEGVRYDGTPESIQEIRRIVRDAIGVDCLEIHHTTARDAEHIEVDNVTMLDFQRLYIQPPADSRRVAIERGSWVVSFVNQEGVSAQVLVFEDRVFHGNFESVQT